MKREEIITELVGVMRDTFDDDEISYRDELTAEDVPDWDSLSNVRFMVAVEQAFGVRLTTGEWEQLKRLGDLVDLLARKRSDLTK